MENVPSSGSAVVEKVVETTGFGEGGFGEPLKVETVPTKPAVSPAQDLRDIQALLVNGIFPGNVAPQIVKAFQMLEQMAQMVEKSAKAEKPA